MKKLSVRNAIIAALNKLDSASSGSLASYTKKPRNQVQTALWHMKNKGEVTVINGIYTLSADNKSKPTKTIKLPKTAPVPVKLEGELAKLDPTETAEDEELAEAMSDPFFVMAKYLDSLAVIRYLEAKLAQRDVHA